MYKLQASDADAGNNKLLTYAITDGNDEGRFILNSGTGILQISPTGLDREISASYNLTVNVTDSGEPVQWVSTSAKTSGKLGGNQYREGTWDCFEGQEKQKLPHPKFKQYILPAF